MSNKLEFMVEDAKLIYLNFRGEEGPFNESGNRNFAIVLDEDDATKLEADGWLVKRTKGIEDEENSSVPFIKVSVSYKNRPPHVTMITSKGRVTLGQDDVGVLDFAELALVDVICTGYRWEVGGKQGVKAYLKTLFVTVREDALEQKYGTGVYNEESID